MSGIILPEPRVDIFTDSPMLTARDVQERARAWEAGEECYSGAVPVGRVNPQAEHSEIFSLMDEGSTGPYEDIWTDNVDIQIGLIHGLTEQGRKLCGSLGRASLGVVLWDAARSGLDPVDFDLIAGWYRAKRDGGRAHVDGTPNTLGRPAVRWFVSFNLPPPCFFEGEVCKALLMPNGVPGEQQMSRLRAVEYPPGTVLRFMTNIDIHQPATSDGPRIVLSALKRVPQDMAST